MTTKVTYQKFWDEPMRQWAVIRRQDSRPTPSPKRTGFWAEIDQMFGIYSPDAYLHRADVAYYATEQEADEGMKRWKERCGPEGEME